MGKPLLLREADDKRIEALKRRLDAHTKIDVVRTALERVERVERWRRAAAIATDESRAALDDFRPGTRLRRTE